MAIARPGREELVAAVVCAGWAAFFSLGEGVGPLLTAPLAGLAVLAYRRRPVAAVLAVAGLQALHTWVLAMPAEDPSLLAAVAVVVYALGRYRTPRIGAGPLTVLLAVFVAADPTIPTAIFSTFVFAVTWVFGHVVRRRTEGAVRAAAVASELAGVDPAVRAAQVVATERARLAGEALSVVRRAVVDMQRHASQAETDLNPAALLAVHHEGRHATAELRRLLGLLRSEPDTEAAPAPESTGRPRRVWRSDGLTAAGLGAFALLEVAVSPAPAGPLTAALSLLLVGAVGLRRTDPPLACLLAVSVPSAALAADVSLPYGMWTLAVVALIAWSVATHARPRGFVALGVLAAVLLLDVAEHHPGNGAMTLGVFGLAGLAGHLWARREREERSSMAAASALRSEHERVAERAVRAERLRLARELHDVASHAVGVMVLQAGAAQALRERDPQRARDAVRTVQAAGVEALAELDVLFGLLDAGAVGATGLATTTPEVDLAAALTALAERITQAGLDVSVTVDDDVPQRPDLVATIYRVVQEALTNATRYAPHARVDVHVRETAGALEVCVRDDGPRGHAATDTGSGFGLVGLAERVRAHGGELAAGPRPEGGFAVTAHLSVDPPVHQSP